VTSPATGAADQPDYAPIPRSALGPALNEQGYYVGRVERNLYYVTDGVYQSAFLTTRDGVVVFDAPPSIGHNIRRAVDEIAAANGVTNTVTHFVYSHHHADHGGAAAIFEGDLARIGHEETRRLLQRDDDPARPLPEQPGWVAGTGAVVGERHDRGRVNHARWPIVVVASGDGQCGEPRCQRCGSPANCGRAGDRGLAFVRANRRP
jgi:glyoxylase-like metal-dependent hydrolase (beta-lactamase superfamily II)